MTIFRVRAQADYIQSTNVTEPYYLAKILAYYDAEQLLLIKGLKGLVEKMSAPAESVGQRSIAICAAQQSFLPHAPQTRVNGFSAQNARWQTAGQARRFIESFLRLS
ncbi:MAG TPA: hypothetical protein VIW72_10575 [Burkholderiales bacterium]